MSYEPRFTITARLLSLVEEVAVLRERVQGATVELAWMPALQKDCRSRNAHASTAIEGNPLTLEQVRALEYPVFTGSTICSHAYCHMLHLGLPVRVGGLMVNQADLLHGDANGVTNIPLDIATEVADIAGDFIAAEEIMLEYVKAPGEKDREEVSRRREQFSEVVAELKGRVSRE